jgi:dTDP-4-amino-4,6-dideoxygalactose transaminase
MTTHAAETLEIEGGAPTRSAPFPQRPIPEPAADERPIEMLEREFATYLGIDAANVISLASYKVACTLALQALGIDPEPGGEVVVPALGAGRIAALLRKAGLTLVPAQVEADTANLGTRGLANALGERTRLVVGVHSYGHPFTGTDIARVIESSGLPLLEDASAAIGASYRFRPTGTLGAAALFEFAPPHLITAGVGGGAMLVVSDTAAATDARVQRDAADDTIDEAAARIALTELRGAGNELAARRQLAWELTFDLRARKGVSGMAHSRWVMHSYDSYVVRIRGLLWKRPLDETLAALIAEGIPCEAAFQASLHLDSDVIAALGDDPRLQDAGFPVASRLPKEAIALPLHGAMTDADITDIARALEKLESASTGTGAWP